MPLLQTKPSCPHRVESLLFSSWLAHRPSTQVIPHRYYALPPAFPPSNLCREHLYRSHTRPISCARCCKSFATEDALVLHSRDVVQCPIAEVPASLDGIDKFQERQLRSRKRTLRQTEAEKWAAVYRILFPTDDPDTIPSPCTSTPAPRLLLV